MPILLKIPLKAYQNLITKCPSGSREYAILRNSFIRQDNIAEIRCNNLDALFILERVKRIDPEAASYMGNGVSLQTLRAAANEYRREPDSQTWHFCSNCTHWPTGFNVIIGHNLPEHYEICNECIVLNQHDECR